MMNLTTRLSKLNDQRGTLMARRKERSRQHQSTAVIDQKLIKTTCAELKETMTMTEQAADAERRHQIEMSCRVIKTHASFVGVECERMVSMPSEYTPGCMDELNEAAGVLQRALGRVERAKEILLSKNLEAAE